MLPTLYVIDKSSVIPHCDLGYMIFDLILDLGPDLPIARAFLRSRGNLSCKKSRKIPVTFWSRGDGDENIVKFAAVHWIESGVRPNRPKRARIPGGWSEWFASVNPKFGATTQIWSIKYRKSVIANFVGSCGTHCERTTCVVRVQPPDKSAKRAFFSTKGEF